MDYGTAALVRFGYGGAAPKGLNAQDILRDLAGRDTRAQTLPILARGRGAALLAAFAPAKRAGRDMGDMDALKAVKAEINALVTHALRVRVARGLDDPLGFRERLHQFWCDHFTVRGRRLRDHPLVLEHQEFAVRPYLAGRFGEMLRAATTHPAMLIYLDQNRSIGPNSKRAKRKPERGLGLNENLAREVMELHTLGVHGSYTQDDVRELAELFTGMSHSEAGGLSFDPALAEPGAERVLGQSYGGDPAKLADIEAALEALARHPDTASHIARKLAVHFVSDTPSEALVSALRAAYVAGEGALLGVYQVLLEHPESLASLGAKVRQPIDYLISSLRMLAVSSADIMAMQESEIRALLRQPMRQMGQRWLEPQGPDGWPEAQEDWISPQELAARIDWAMRIPQRLKPLPDAVALLQSGLGDRAGEMLAQAVPRAESRAEGVGLVLASVAANRR